MRRRNLLADRHRALRALHSASATECARGRPSRPALAASPQPAARPVARRRAQTSRRTARRPCCCYRRRRESPDPPSRSRTRSRRARAPSWIRAARPCVKSVQRQERAEMMSKLSGSPAVERPSTSSTRFGGTRGRKMSERDSDKRQASRGTDRREARDTESVRPARSS